MAFLSFLNSFAQGMDPFSTRLILGDFEFLDFEVPERIAIPGKQKTVIHQMIGGRRTVDVLGVEYDAITWTGIFTGPETESRVQALERLRDAGQQIALTLDQYSFTVVITNFTPVYEFIYRRPYSIEVAVVSRDDTPNSIDALTGTLDALVNSDVGTALGLSSVINVSDVTSAVNTVQSAVKQVTDFAHATVDTIQTVVRPIIAARNVIHSTILTVESAANQITTLGGIIPGNPVSTTINNVLAQVDQSTKLPALYQLNNVLSRLNKNVQSGQTADGVRTITISGGNLYQVSSDQYGDPSLWESIASANGLSDPQLTGINTLTIPSNPATASTSTTASQ
jgi:ethanolamine utilization microcompartment shell protein EutS